jgi:hypothetical protein
MVAGFEDQTHPTLTQFVDDLIMSQTPTDHELSRHYTATSTSAARQRYIRVKVLEEIGGFPAKTPPAREPACSPATAIASRT